MTRLDAMRALVSAPRDHADQGRIGLVRKPEHARPDGREKLTMVFKVLNFTKRRAS